MNYETMTHRNKLKNKFLLFEARHSLLEVLERGGFDVFAYGFVGGHENIGTKFNGKTFRIRLTFVNPYNEGD